VERLVALRPGGGVRCAGQGQGGDAGARPLRAVVETR
jgi:hypothetical protein